MQLRQRVLGKPSLLSSEVVDEFCPVGVVLAHVVVVNSLLEQLAVMDERVDRGGCGVRASEERLAVNLTDESSVVFDDGVRANHLQVENDPAGLDRVDHLAQDVHDVLRFHSSE